MGKILDNLNEKFSSSGDLISESIKNIDLNLATGGGVESKPLYPVVKIKTEINSETNKKVISSFEFIEGVVPLDITGAKLIVIEEYQDSYATYTMALNALLCYKEDDDTGAIELSDVFAFDEYRFELSQDKKTIVGVNAVHYELQSIFDSEYETQTVSDMWTLNGWWHDYVIVSDENFEEIERIKYDYVIGLSERWYADYNRGFYSLRLGDENLYTQITVIYPNKSDPNSYVEFRNGDVLWKWNY